MMLRLALCVLLAACSREPPPLTEAVLDIARSHSAEPDASDFARTELDRIAAAVRAQGSTRDALLKVVFEQYAFAREVDDPSLRFVLLPSVLQLRRGSCVGLGTLFLALAERLGLEMHGVMVPGHFYVQLRENGQLHNIELLRQGEELPDAWYRERWPIVAPSPAYARPLSAREVEAVLLFDIGNDRKRARALAQAERAYLQAGQRFPTFAEAHASAGSVAHLLGALDRAQAAYTAARAANPNLPGLEANIALLQAEAR
jgi:regulator of sirC expression with transglutaminase-like and TPR domain